MRTPLQVAITLAGGLCAVLGTVLLLVLAQYSATALASGVVLIVVGAAVFVTVPVARRRAVRGGLVAALLATLGVWAVARYGGDTDSEPRPPTDAGSGSTSARASAQALARGLDLARDSLAALEGVTDYACTWSKRERAKSLVGRVRLTDERLELKVRRRPRSIYIRYAAPAKKAGTEAIYVEGRNDGKMIAHSTRSPLKHLGTLRLRPTDWAAMVDQRYPITRMGLRTISEEFLRIADEHAAALATCQVRFLDDESVDGRPCHCMEIVSPEPMPGFPLALARVHWDRVWRVPVRLERWEYLAEDGKLVKRLTEAYTATNLRFDLGLRDLDFDPANPDYGY